jgi:protein SCO1/2
MALPKPPKYAIWVGLAGAIALTVLFRTPSHLPDEITKRAMEMKVQQHDAASEAFSDDTGEGLDPASGEPEPSSLGGPFSLIDHTGRAVTDGDYQGSYILIYFASSDCADSCAQGLDAMTLATNRIEQSGKNIKPIIITTDPERDSVAALAQFAAGVHPRLTALTGSTAQIERAAQAYGIDLDENTAGSPIFLIDPQGRYVTQFDRSIAPDDLSASIRSYF